MFVIKHRKFFYIFTLTLLAASLASVLFFGLKLGLDFTGGSLLEVEYLNKRPEIPGLEERFLLLGYSGASCCLVREGILFYLLPRPHGL